MSNTSLFATPEGVAYALKRYRDVFDPKTASVIVVSTGRYDPSGGPFRNALLTRLDEREELRRRMTERLEARERHLLFLWYVADLAPSEVARRLRISRMHAYRLRKAALGALCDEEAATA
ncbi:MAG TPA: hypothetical protein VKY26_04345 [Actinomycetota bacterium]|nr:hypothetical protein [Actinomycetota bacterium]